MSLNKFMHPRNRYKIARPDFEALGQKYPEFKAHLVENAKGKPALDFQNPEALRILTICMLKEDYNLKIELPPDRLVPTLPLRLNYVHWIEDMTKDWNKQELNAIDIGTGACCVYPILATYSNPWRFLATEADDVNFSYAVKNMEQNKLTNKIKVVKVASNIIVEGVVAPTEETFDFCMCNPPFFSDHFEAQGLVSRSPSRPEAKTMSTASPQEGIVPGGEVGFVRKMIEESNFLQDKVRVYTTMLGKKASLAPLKEILRRYKKSLFTQGKKEGKKSVVHVIPTRVGGRREPLYDLVVFFKQLFSELKIHFREGKQSPFFALLTLTAAENTWIHSRRKRRQMMREEAVTATTATSETSSTSVETSASASECGGNADSVSTTPVPHTGEQVKEENASAASSDATEELRDGVNQECGTNKVMEESCEGVKDGKDTATSITAVQELSDGDKEHNKSLNKPGDMDKKEGKDVDSSASLSEQSNSKADSEHLKRKSDTETAEFSDSPPAKRVKLSDNSSSEKNLETPAEMEVVESSDCSSSTKQTTGSCPDPQSSEDVSDGMETLPTSSAGDQVASVEKEADCSVPEEGREEKGKGEKGKERPPPQFVLKCHMSVRVQGSDLAVELSWLDGQDIQLMHQLMQVFKNRLTQRKPAT